MPQTTYITTLAVGKVGTRADDSGHEAQALSYEERHQTDTLTVANEEDGDFTVVLDGETVTYTDDTDATNTVTAAGIAAAINTAAAVPTSVLNNLLSATSAAAVVTLTTLREGESYTVGATSAPGGATLTHASTQSSTQAALPLACAVQQNGDNGLILPSSTSTDAGFAGLIESGSNEEEATDAGVSGGYAAGKSIPIMEKGAMYASPEDAVVKGGDVYVRRVATGTELFGALRGSHDGTARVETVTPTAANDQMYQLRLLVDHDGNGDYRSYTLGALGDGSATATEICTVFKADLATITELTGVVTGSGTATFIMTGAAGIQFASADVGPGVSSVAETTAGAFDTYKLNGAKWRLAAGAAGVSIVKVNRP